MLFENLLITTSFEVKSGEIISIDINNGAKTKIGIDNKNSISLLY